MKKGLFLLLFLLVVFAVHGQKLPYQDSSLSFYERAKDLSSRLTLEEKSILMMDISKPIERLGIPQFIWWSEALHGVGRNGKCTVFPSCIGMAASFDDELLEQIYTAVSDEARAKNTLQRKTGNVFRYQGLSFWTPNINIFRDPRWGRGQETYGEDPYMNAHMGSAVVRGLQGPLDSKYRKLFACAKHYAVHSGPEKIRHTFDIENLPTRDLWETYLPAFKELVVNAGVKEVMCAYQRFEGEPCCGSNRLLQQILRDEWGFQGLVVSDCGAISDFWMEGRHGVSPDAPSAVAKAIISGTDLECGSTFVELTEAVKQGKISEEKINESLIRLLIGRFELGDFDRDDEVEWTKIPESVIACKEHKALAFKMACEDMVLLKNDGILPLNKDSHDIVVMGPNAADSVMLWGIYYGQPTHSVTCLEGIREKLGQDVKYIKGCDYTAMTENVSLFDRLTSPDGTPGMKGSFWNNTSMEGEPVYQQNYTSALKFDNGGNTVFAPGVNLTNFTASFKGEFLAERDETLELIFATDDGVRLIVNGDTIVNRWRAQELKLEKKNLKVKAGEKFLIEFDYMQLLDEAAHNFDVSRNQDVTIDEVLQRVSDKETIIFDGGLTPELEREEAKVNAPGFDGGDRTSIELPKVQRELLEALSSAGKKIVLVNCSGSAVALERENETCNAIIQAWYPGEQGGAALADVLLGDYNPEGKLPVTFYKNDSQLPPFEDYSMKGRTYRYFDGEALYPFGYGLSYTTFSLDNLSWDEELHKVSIDVTNTGEKDGVEVIQVYLKYIDDEDGPIKSLRGFSRVELNAGQKKTVSIDLPTSSFEWWDKDTNTMHPLNGKYNLMVGTSSQDQDLKVLSVFAPK